MVRIEIFRNISATSQERAFVAVLEALERTPGGKQTISVCMNFFASTAQAAADRATEFVEKERARVAQVELTFQRRRKKAEAA